MLCRSASVSLRLRSRSESSWSVSAFCCISDLKQRSEWVMEPAVILNGQLIHKKAFLEGNICLSRLIHVGPRAGTCDKIQLICLHTRDLISSYLLLFPLLLLPFLFLPYLSQTLFLTLQLSFEVTFVWHFHLLTYQSNTHSLLPKSRTLQTINNVRTEQGSFCAICYFQHLTSISYILTLTDLPNIFRCMYFLNSQ